MQNITTEFKDLCNAVEREVHRTLSAPSDFKWLSEQIEARTQERLSHSTLMRLWGYTEGVKPRTVTLDILARFLGYMGYADFMEGERKEKSESENGKEKSSEKSECSESPEIIAVTEQAPPQAIPELCSPTRSLSPVGREVGSSKTSISKWVLGIAAMAALVAGGIYMLRHKPQPVPVYVTELRQLSNTKQYIIHTRHKARGSLGVVDRHLGTTWAMAAQNRCEEASPFAIIEHEGSYYLYSVVDECFIDVGIYERDAPLASNDCAIDIHQEGDSCFVMDFKTCKTVCSLNINNVYGPFVTDYGTINKMFDDGNMLMLEEVGDFDPTEALAKMVEPTPEYAAALHAVTPGRYVIYTGEERRFYMKADGQLTETLTDSCIFDIEIVEKNSEQVPPYRLPAWRLVWLTDTAEAAHDSWHDKVFFLDENGCYAVRSTNVPIEAYGAGRYWSASDPDGDGCLEVDYSPKRTFVWHLSSSWSEGSCGVDAEGYEKKDGEAPQ